MKKFELKWIWHHPIKWIRICWWHWTVAIVLVSVAFLRSNPVFEPLYLYNRWPVIIGAIGGMVGLSALAPLDSRIQITVASMLFGLSTFQVIGFFLAVADPTVSEAGNVIALTFATHWFLMGAIALQWVRLSYIAGAWMTVEVGREEANHVA